MYEIMKMFQKQISDSIDKEIRSTILGATGFDEESDYSVNNAINAIERAQAIITDVIICNETTKEQFDGMDIPKTMEIIPAKLFERWRNLCGFGRGFKVGYFKVW